MRQLNVFIDHRHVGVLSEAEDLWVFEYDEAWARAAGGFDLGPGLPREQQRIADGGTNRPVQWYFDNLLPEEGLRQAISKEAHIKGEDAFALLEYLGAESAGSLTLLPPGQEPSAGGGLKDLSDEALSKRIENLPRSTLTADAPKRMSLAGAQHKLLVVMQGDHLFEPVGATPSTHILKPSHDRADSYPGSVVNEFITMRLADACGLPVAPVQLRCVPQPVYIIERFDRRIEVVQKGPDVAEPRIYRRHIIDACQLLNRSRAFKHTGASLQALQQVIERTTNKAAARLQLFRWLVFNVAVANDDCHLKNLSFFVSAEGVALAPHYDLLSTSIWNTRAFADDKENWPHGRMAFALPGAERFAQVTSDSLFEAAKVLGVPYNPALRILREVVTTLPPALDKEALELEAVHKGLPEASRRLLAVESKLVRVMQKMVIADMVARMTPKPAVRPAKS